MYSSGSTLGSAAILIQNPIFEMASSVPQSDLLIAKEKSMELKLTLEEAKQRALEFMYRGYH